MSTCHICKRELDVATDPTTKDCGGDCLRCMAEMKRIRRSERKVGWPQSYFSGPQKLSKVHDGVHPLLGDYKRVPFDVAGTITGRLTRAEPEMQELRPRRPIVDVDSPLVNVDHSQIEARILAQIKEKK